MHLSEISGKSDEKTDANIGITALPNPLTEREYQSLIIEYNDSAASYPSDETIVALFEAQVARTPTNKAVQLADRSLTYAQLNERANQMAAHLRSRGIGPGRLVTLYMEHSIEVVCAILGVLKAGAAYVPVDPSSTPEERLAFILQDIAGGTGGVGTLPVLVTQSRLLDKIPQQAADVVVLESNFSQIERYATANPEIAATPHDLAYAIYTSGSTGKPKGVLIEHRSLVNYIWWANQKYCHGEQLAWPLFSSLAFDLTVTSIFTPLISGGRIVVYAEESGRHWTAILRVAEDGQADIVKLTPSHLAMIKGMNLHATRIRKFIVGGEDFKTDLAREVTEKIGHPVEIYNEYGPTEATVGCMIHCFDSEKDRGASVPIGVPASNFGIYILDDLLNPVPTGVIGEMYLAGDGLARGYLNRPELTAQKFIMVKDPRHSASVGRSSDAERARMYKTGDLARWSADGRIEFLGRADYQVKIGGMRIELGEIEARLMSQPDIQECVVDVTRNGVGGTSQTDDTERDRLVAYYVSKKPLPVAEVRAHLAKELPDYMVPPYVVWLERLPLTPNGKIDRKALPVPSHEHTQPPNRDSGHPRTETEKAVAAIWKELLRIEDIGIDDDLFNLGGDSLLPIRAESRIREAFGVNIGIQTLFDNPTIAGLASLLDSSKNSGDTKNSGNGKKPVGPLFYRRRWVRTETPAVAPAEPSRWMIFMDSLGLGRQISAQLNGAQHQVIEVSPGKAFTRVRKGEYLIRPGNRADYDALILDVTRRGVLPQRIVNLWSVCDGSAQVSTDETLNLSFYSLVNLAQTLKEQDLSGVDIAVVSNHLQSVSGEPVVAPLRATMLGPLKVIPKEMPGMVCRNIDCDPIGQGTGYVAVQVITEHLSPFTDQVVVYRSDERWVESLEQMELPKTVAHNRAKSGATYFITGGLGPFGLIIAEHLARNGPATLILVDQTPLPPSTEWSEALTKGNLPEHTRGLIKRLTEVHSLGCEVVTICSDLGRAGELTRTFEAARTKFGPINGVIDASAVRDVKPLKTGESAVPVLASTINANLGWEKVLSDESLDFLALFSSPSSCGTGAEQVESVAASAFLDAFACSQNGKPVVAIDWRTWIDAVEFAADVPPQPTDKISRLEATEAFTRVLAKDMPANVIVSAQDLVTTNVAAKAQTGRVSAPPTSTDDVESVLLDWWKEFSNSDHVALDDNFFDLGGDSLAAVQLFSKIKTAYGLNLGLATLFETPTVRQLSNLIRQASTAGPAKPKPWSPVVPIQPKGKRPPLYVISGLGGNVIKFHSLAFHLGEDQPMFGLLPRGLDGKDSFHTRIEDMAAYYVEAIRTIQPQGPYCLAGYSFGGIVAFEVAQQIVAQGGNVKFLGLFDSIEWHYADKVDGSLAASQRLTALKEHLKNIVAGPDRYSYVKYVLKMLRIKYHLFNVPDRLEPGKIGALEEVNGYAATNYYPRAYPGKLTLFRSTKRAVQQGHDEYLGWGQLAIQGVDVHHVPGTHFSLLQEPEVRNVAEKLRSCLQDTVG